MTQQAVQNKIYENKFLSGWIKNTAVQTTNHQDFNVQLTQKKSIRVYYSTSYKTIVVSFNFGTKAFIFTKSMWIILKKYFTEIDFLINND